MSRKMCGEGLCAIARTLFSLTRRSDWQCMLTGNVPEHGLKLGEGTFVGMYYGTLDRMSIMLQSEK
jgi:hypothetical protein